VNFQPAVKDLAVLAEADVQRLVVFYQEQLDDAQRTLGALRLGARPAEKKQQWPRVPDLPSAPPAPPPPAPTVLELSAIVARKRKELGRAERDLELAEAGHDTAVRQAKAALDDLGDVLAEVKREEDARPIREWEEKRRREEENRELVRLEHSSDYRDWQRAKEIRDSRTWSR
jgi:hypothetical protein